jgi:hypothetical protein
MNGSIYGAGTYSAGLYSWFAAWMLIACDPVTVRTVKSFEPPMFVAQ